MKMSHRLSFSAIAFVALASNAFPSFSQDARFCMDVVEVKHGDRCGNPQSIEVTVRNICNQPIDIQICLRRVDSGKWECGLTPDAAPNKKAYYSICKGTGDYELAARNAGSKYRFPH